MHFGDGNITLVDTVKYFVLLRLTVSFQATMLLYYLCQGRGYVVAFVGLFGTTGWRSTWKNGRQDGVCEY